MPFALRIRILAAACLFTLACMPLHAAPKPTSGGGSAAPKKETRTQEPSRQSFRVLWFTPSGEARTGEPICVTFSSDVVTSRAMETTRSKSSFIAFDPQIDGVFEWATPSRLQFLPAGPLRPCTRFEARISSLLTDLKGRKLEGPTEFRFNTRPLTLEKAQQTGFTGERQAIVTLEFNDAVVPTDLQKYLSVDSAGMRLRWKLESDVKSRTPRIITDAAVTESLTLVIEPGLRGAGGPLGLDKRVVKQVPLTFKLVPEQLTAAWEQDRASLRLRMSNPVSMERIRDYLSVEPQVQFEVSDEYDVLKLSGDFRPERRYTVRLRSGLAGTNGSVALSDTSLSVWVPALPPFVQLVEAGGHLSPGGSMKLRVKSAGIPKFSVAARRVFDTNLPFYVLEGAREYTAVRWGADAGQAEVAVEGGAAPTTTYVNLNDVLGQKPCGTFLVTVEGRKPGAGGSDDDYDEYDYEGNRRLRRSALISVSRLGLVAKQSGSQVAVWCAALDSAKPAAGVHVRIYSTKNQLLKEGDTGADGFATFGDLSPDPDARPAVAVATLGEDVCYLDLRKTLSGAEAFRTEGRDYVSKGYEAFVSPERGAYRPGETVHLFGLVRGKDAQAPAPFPLEVEIERPDNKRWEPRPVTLSPSGAMTLDVSVPGYAPTGLYKAHVQLAGTAQRRNKPRPIGYESYSWRYDEEEGEQSKTAVEREELGVAEFFVEEFLPNRLKVETSAPDKRFSATEPLSVQVVASEMFGQPAANRSVAPVVTYRAEAFAPKAFKGYTFGDATVKFTAQEKELEELTVGADGRVAVEVPPSEKKPPAALRADVQVVVKDIGGRGVTSRISRTIDPFPVYIGVRQEAETFAESGKEARFDIAVVKPDATLADTQNLTATVSRVHHHSILRREENVFRWVSSEELSQVQEFAVTVAEGRGVIAWTPADSGEYLVRVAYPATGSRTSLRVYVSRREWREQPWSMEKPEELELVADRARYAPGDTARILVKAPFAGTLLVTTEQDRMLSSSIVEMPQNTCELEIPVSAEHLPNFFCVATLVRPVKPAEKWLPHRAFGMANVRVEPAQRRLAVELAGPAESRSETEIEVPFAVRDAATSQGIGADLNVWAVDEGILTLTGYETPDPLAFFYSPRRLMVSTADFYSDLMPDITEPPTKKSAPGGDTMEGAARRMSPVSAERVRPVSLWLGTLKTDSTGRGIARFKIPQFMGQLRVMAVAAAGQQFGCGQQTVFVRNPVMVKENMPRFLAPGDAIVAPFVVYNNTDQAATVAFSVDTSGPVQCAGSSGAGVAWSGNGCRVEIAARGMKTVPVSFTAEAAAGGTPVGVAGIAYRAEMNGERYADRVEVPVRPASPVTRVTAYETLRGVTGKTVKLLDQPMLDGTLSGTLAISSKPALRFAGAIDYLLRYPYGCLEQTVSSAFPLLYFEDLARQVHPGAYTAEAIRDRVQAGIDRVVSMQVASGGLATWPGSRDAWPWGTIYAAHFLLEARKAGFTVPEEYMREMLSYIEARLAGKPPEPVNDSLTERCYGVYVLALGGRRNLERMENLFERRESLPPSARALLAAAFAVAGNAKETAELLSSQSVFQPKETVRQTGGILSSPTRETAILLSVALETNTAAAEIPALVRRLEAAMKTRGHWGTTQENSFALWALGLYLRKTAADTAPFSGTLKTPSGETLEFSTSTPLTLAADKAVPQVEVTCIGDGAAYLAFTAEGVPMAPASGAESHGITVARRFENRHGDPLDLKAIRQGSLVIVEIELGLPARMQNVIIEDLLPAGLEIENGNLASAEHSEAESGPVTRTEVRDDRMVAFVNGGGKQVVRYAARAVTQGTFVLPGVHASCMYDPDIWARSVTGTVVVVPADSAEKTPQ